MRVIEEIPHPKFKIQILNYNSKYIVKVELGQYEQSYKIGESDVMGVADIKSMVNKPFLSKCLHRFIEMRSDWEVAFKAKNIPENENETI